MFDEGRGGVLWSMLKFMHRVHNVLHARLSQIGLFRGQPPVLHFLCLLGPMSQKELADRLGLSPATMTVTLKRMEKAGLIERHTDPTDQRVQLVNITEHGSAMNDAAASILSEIRDECLMGFSEQERKGILDDLERMSQNLEPFVSASAEDTPK